MSKLLLWNVNCHRTQQQNIPLFQEWIQQCGLEPYDLIVLPEAWQHAFPVEGYHLTQSRCTAVYSKEQVDFYHVINYNYGKSDNKTCMFLSIKGMTLIVPYFQAIRPPDIDVDYEKRREEIGSMLTYYDNHVSPYRVIMCGDWNIDSQDLDYTSILSYTGLYPVSPDDTPTHLASKLCLDHIAVSDDVIATSTQLGPNLWSDHRQISTSLRFTGDY